MFGTVDRLWMLAERGPPPSYLSRPQSAAIAWGLSPFFRREVAQGRVVLLRRRQLLLQLRIFLLQLDEAGGIGAGRLAGWRLTRSGAAILQGAKPRYRRP